MAHSVVIITHDSYRGFLAKKWGLEGESQIIVEGPRMERRKKNLGDPPPICAASRRIFTHENESIIAITTELKLLSSYTISFS